MPEPYTHDIFSLVSCAVSKSISSGSVKPITRCIESLLFSLHQNQSKESLSLFSCDSFCDPHLKYQIDFIGFVRPLVKSYVIQLVDIPVAHYCLSLPSQDLLAHARRPSSLFSINTQLSRHDIQLPHNTVCILAENDDYYRSLSYLLEEAYAALPDSSFLDATVNGFLLRSAAIRDLSLTYKLSAERLYNRASEHSIFLSHAIRILLWELLILASTPQLPAQSYYSGVYSASIIFQHFCLQTNRHSSLFSPAPHQLVEGFRNSSPLYFNVYRTYSSVISYTKPHVKDLVLNAALTPKALEAVHRSINHRVTGQTSTYSSPINQSQTSCDDTKILQAMKRRYDKVFAIIPSSPDETTGHIEMLQLEGADTSHLYIPYLSTQDDWLIDTIKFVSNNLPDFGFIVRLHPRLGSDYRGLPESPDLEGLLHRLNSLTDSISNVHVVSPYSSISSYYLALNCNGVINGWSTLGLELSIIGISVLNVFQDTIYSGGSYFCLPGNGCILSSSSKYHDALRRYVLNRCSSDLGIPTPTQAAIAYYLVYCGHLSPPLHYQQTSDQAPGLSRYLLSEILA